jgi:hypothetical protein
MISETVIENYLVKKVKEMGGIAYKFVSPGNAGVPDRLCLFPTGYVVFVELKRPDGTVSARQLKQIKRIKDVSCHCVVINSRPKIDSLLNHVANIIKVRENIGGYI